MMKCVRPARKAAVVATDLQDAKVPVVVTGLREAKVLVVVMDLRVVVRVLELAVLAVLADHQTPSDLLNTRCILMRTEMVNSTRQN